MTVPVSLPLDGLRVVEIGTMITAPLASKILAEMGAEIIKVERPPSGDPFRSFLGGNYAPHFRAYNVGKQSIVVDLTAEEGKAELRGLLEKADVLIENFRPGVMERLGFSEDAIARDYPNLIYCSITGFGPDGPYAKRPAYDTVALALSGVGHLKIDPENPGVSGPTLSDNVTGMYAAHGILAALLGRANGATARRVEVNMLEASIAFTPDSFATSDEGHKVDRLTRVRASQSYAMTCADGHVITIHLSSAVKFWDALMAAVESPEIAQDSRFATRDDRYRNYPELQKKLADLFRSRPLADWVDRLTAHDVPFSPVVPVEDVAKNEQVQHLGTFTEVRAGDGKLYRVINSPVRFDGVRSKVRHAPPLLGEHDAPDGHTNRRKSKMKQSLSTAISQTTETAIRWRGLDLMSDILGKHDFSETMYLLITGRLPEPWERTIFDASLITLMEHGLTPHAIVSRLVADSNPDQIQIAIASGLTCVGDVFAGTMEGCGRLLTEGLQAEDQSAWCKETATAFRMKRAPLPGFGHPQHKPDDPRTPRLFQIAREAGAPGQAISLLEEFGAAVDEVYGRHLTINATGALAALLLEVGIHPGIMRGIAVTSRAAGLTAHIAEELQTRSGRKIWQLVESEFAYTGP